MRVTGFGLVLLLLCHDGVATHSVIASTVAAREQMDEVNLLFATPSRSQATLVPDLTLLGQAFLETQWTTSKNPEDGVGEGTVSIRKIIRENNLNNKRDLHQDNPVELLATHAGLQAGATAEAQAMFFTFFATVPVVFMAFVMTIFNRFKGILDFGNITRQSMDVWHPKYLSVDSSPGFVGADDNADPGKTLPSFTTSNARSAELRGVSALNEAMSAPGVFLLWTAMFLFGLGHNVSGSNPSAPDNMPQTGPFQVFKRFATSSFGKEGSRGTHGNISTQSSAFLGTFFMGFAVIQIFLAFMFGKSNTRARLVAMAALQYLTGMAVTTYIEGDQQENAEVNDESPPNDVEKSQYTSRVTTEP